MAGVDWLGQFGRWWYEEWMEDTRKLTQINRSIVCKTRSDLIKELSGVKSTIHCLSLGISGEITTG
jgi:hypothetical protein